MLDNQTIETVKATAPVLKEHSDKIGKRFYELLFSKAPDLYNMFNQTNQKRGIQQEALAYSVYAAGENIDNLEVLQPVIRRITEKHRAIGVKAEQYPVVGETLLEAVKDVLGDAATEEILDAWGKAYGYIADAFIQIEDDLYEETENDLNWLQSILPSNDADFYLCGPIPFLQAMVRLLNQWEVPKDQIRFEVFNPIAILGE